MNIIKRANFVIGAPASGKSTYIKKHKKATDIVVDLKDFQDAKPILTLETIIDSYMDAAEALEKACATGKDVWFEHTLMLKSRRPLYISLAKLAGYEVNAYCLQPDRNAFIANYQARHKSASPAEALHEYETYYNNLDFPSSVENFDNIYHVVQV